MQALLEPLRPLLAPAFTAGGVAFTWLEMAAFVMGVAMVLCNLRVSVWGWPLAIGSSLAYALLFADGRLYGQAALQGVFIGVSAWGWWRWRSAPAEHSGRRGIGDLTARQRWVAATATLVCWAAIAEALRRAGGADTAGLDALTTAASLTAQALLALKRRETWPLWLAVNVLSVALFSMQGLWLTALLYAVFAVLSVLGWQAWREPVGAASDSALKDRP